MKFSRHHSGESALRAALGPSMVGKAPLQYGCKMGNYTFLIACNASGAWTATWKDSITGRTNWLGDNGIAGKKHPEFETQTQAERACEAQWKKLRN